MRKLVPFLVMLGLLAMVFPAAAKTKERVGLRIDVLFGNPSSFTEGAPFHIVHGWAPAPSDTGPVGIYDFELEVDGVSRREDFVERTVESGDPVGMARWWVFNFPEGMAGTTHTFTGHWLGPCQQLVDDGYPVGPCDTPNEEVEATSRSLTVTFTP
jgi:hypothetical protein